MFARARLRSASGRAARRGQAAVFVALCLVALLLVVAFSTNMGILVNDKVRMQETADLATYAVAYSEAASLNDLTKLNQGIAEAAQDCRQKLEHGGAPWSTPCNCSPTDPQAEIEVQLCKISIDEAIYQFVERATYDKTVGKALKAGRATAQANFDGTEDHTIFFEDFPGSPTFSGTYWIRWTTSLAGGGAMPSIADFEQITNTAFNYQFNQYCGSWCSYSGTVPSPTYIMPTWFRKETRDPDVWVAGRVAGTPKKRFLDTAYGSGSDGGYFGSSSSGGDDKLIAYAVAKPYDGSVGPSGLSGMQADGNMLSGLVYGSQYIEWPKQAMVEEYRARIAGVNDDLQGSTSPSDLVFYDGMSMGKMWDMDKFEH